MSVAPFALQAVDLDIAADHPAYAGHFPGMPILPGVVLLDVALQAMGTRLAHLGIALDSCKISSVKFLSPARPGETLRVEFESRDGSALRFDILSGTRKIASGSLQPTLA